MKSSPSHLPSLLGSLLFIVGAVLFLSVAVIMGITALATLFTGKSIQAQQTIALTVFSFEALILLIAAYISIQKYRQQDSAERDTSLTLRPRQVVSILFLTAIAIFIGYRTGSIASINWLLLPILTLPAVVLPLIILLALAIRGIPLGARWRSWNIFGIAMTLVPFILIFLEIFVFIIILIFVVGYLVSLPGFAAQAEQLSRQIYLLGPESQEVADLFLPYITKPGVVAVVLLYFAVAVPMLEEIFKPLGVWIFANKLTSPAQGFALGALSGTGYALIETLGVSAQTGDWAGLLLSRVGTGMLHITTSGIMGAAIVYLIRERRYARLLGAYLLAVSLHGLWNAMAILYGFSTMTAKLGQQTYLSGLRMPLMIGMAILAVVLLIILISSNQRMRDTLPAMPEERAA